MIKKYYLRERKEESFSGIPSTTSRMTNPTAKLKQYAGIFHAREIDDKPVGETLFFPGISESDTSSRSMGYRSGREVKYPEMLWTVTSISC
mmetsp:Transcript_19842/g.39553  ORF Transcript_19842/g.39553 Transcript_19842/m.39553 type:complete len:91 (+) Transcript_19842:46-318(+)